MPLRPRVAVWAGLCVLGTLLVVVHLTVADDTVRAALQWAIALAPIPLSSVVSFIVFTRTRGEERRFWLLLALATTLLTFSESFWAYAVVFIDPLGVELPHPFELLQAAAALLFFALLVLMTRFGAEPLPVRFRFYADIGLTMVIGFVASYRWIAVPLFAEVPDASTGLLMVAAVYPVVGVFLVGGTFVVLVGMKSSHWRPWERYFALSVTVYGVGILLWPWWYSSFITDSGRSVTGIDLESLLTAGYYLLFVAGVYRLVDPCPAAVPRSVSAPVGRWPWATSLYPGLMTLLLLVLVLASVGSTSPDDRVTYLVASAVLAGLLAIRSWLVTLESSHLLSRSMSDPVTGVGNLRALESLRRYAGGSEWGGCVLAVDIDGFHRVNELGGHPEGDRVLRHVALVVSRVVGGEGLVYRVSGDDFVVVLHDADEGRATELATRCVLEVEREVKSSSTPMSISVGIACGARSDRTLTDATDAAFEAQRSAFIAGGGRAHTADMRPDDPPDSARRLREVRRGRYLATVRALAGVVDGRDPQSAGHSRAVARIAVLLAAELGFSGDRLDRLETAGFLHDIGKVAIDDSVLRQERRLTDSEFAAVRSHPVLGERIVGSAGLEEVTGWVRHHHERWDGAGYPDGLSGEAIPIEARVLAVADAYDVMTTGRSYQPSLGHHAALRQIELEAGAQFDPSVAATFVRLMWDSADPATGRMHPDHRGGAGPHAGSAERS